MPAAEKEGYQFVGWYIDEARTRRLNPGGILPGVITIYDKWVPVWYPVIYDVKGGSNDPTNPRLISVESEAIALRPASKPGKFFDGWYWRGKKVEALPQKIHAPLYLEARFKDAFRIHFNCAGGAKLESMSAGENNQIPVLPVPRRTGYTFTGWFLDTACTKPVPSSGILRKDATFYAAWQPEVYEIAYEMDGGINSRRNPKSYTHFDKEIVLYPARKKGYEFQGWFDSRGRKVDAIPARSMGKYILSARFEKIR